MALNKSAIAWNVGAIGAGAWGMIVFAQSSNFDLFAFVATLKRTWGDLVTLSGFIFPLVTAGAVAYRTFGMKQVPNNSVAAAVDKVENLPGISPDKIAAVAKSAASATALLFGFLFLFPPQAFAQTVKKTVSPLVSGAEQFGFDKLAQSALVKALGAWGADDVSGAGVLALAIPDLQDGVGKSCWDTFAAMGAVIKNHPLPATFKLATDIEAGRLFLMAVKNVCKKPECSQMFNEITNQIGAFTPIPPAISLTSICAKIP